MTIVTGDYLRQRIGMIEPWNERETFNGMSYGVSIAGYDVRIDQEITLAPGGFSLASTVERFNIPNDLMGIVHDKSTLARMGLTVQNTVIEPGWSGWLTLELANHGPSIIALPKGAPIAQIIFHNLCWPVDKGYTGKYNNQERGPQSARFENPNG